MTNDDRKIREKLQQKTWNDILAAMIQVRNAHGWS